MRHSREEMYESHKHPAGRRPVTKRLDPLATYEVAASGCWMWRGAIDKHGYGRIGGRNLAHRVVYALLRGEIPPGLELDHLCRVPGCVNPDHLEPVTHAENVRRGTVGAVNRARQLGLTHCKRGHPFDVTNTGIDRKGYRFCRECMRSLHRGYYRRDRDKRSEAMKEATHPIMVRQGDVALVRVDKVPRGAKARTGKGALTLAYGEVTGHRHTLVGDAEVLDAAEAVYVQVMSATDLVHQEHATVTLDPGVWKYVPQREYSPEAIRRVLD